MVRRLSMAKNNHLTYYSLALNPRNATYDMYSKSGLKLDSTFPQSSCSTLWMVSFTKVCRQTAKIDQSAWMHTADLSLPWTHIWRYISHFPAHICIFFLFILFLVQYYRETNIIQHGNRKGATQTELTAVLFFIVLIKKNVDFSKKTRIIKF